MPGRLAAIALVVGMLLGGVAASTPWSAVGGWGFAAAAVALVLWIDNGWVERRSFRDEDGGFSAMEPVPPGRGGTGEDGADRGAANDAS